MKKSKKIYSYTAIFDSAPKAGYTVIVPSLPGLVTEGRNLEEAKRNAEDAIRCYIEGLKKIKISIPEEHQIAQMRLAVSV